MKTNDQFFSPMKKAIDKELLKYTAGHHIFCPQCKEILDWETVVIIDVFHGEKKKGSLVCCSNCFKPSGAEALKEKGITLEITRHES